MSTVCLLYIIKRKQTSVAEILQLLSELCTECKLLIVQIINYHF